MPSPRLFRSSGRSGSGSFARLEAEAQVIGTERRLGRVRAVRRRLAQDGPPWSRGRADDFDVGTVPEGDCDALRDLLIAEGVETIVEVGLAYGRSALAIGEALVADAAFVDGSHRFHEVFVDLYFLGKIVRSGGTIVVDDH